VNNGQGAAM
jgi:hypothetical protein